MNNFPKGMQGADKAVKRLGREPATSGILVAKMLEWRRWPQVAATEIFGEPFTAQQLEIADPLFAPLSEGGKKRVICKSGNGPGKTNAFAKILLIWDLTRQGYIVSTAPTWNQVQTKLWAEVARVRKLSKFPLGGKFLPDSCQIKHGAYWYAHGVSTTEEANISGGHAPSVLALFDEAHGIRGAIWDGVEGMMAGGEWCRTGAVGNPLQASGRFYQNFRSAFWHKVTLSCLDHPNVKEQRIVIPGAVTYEWVQERLEEWGETDPRYLAKVLGQFPEGGSNLVVSIGMLENAIENDGHESGIGVHCGIDVARFGDDETIFCWTRDGRLEEEQRFAGKDGNEIAGLLITEAKQRGLTVNDAASRLHVDSIGIGASVMDALSDSGWYADGVNFGAGPRGNYADLHGEEALFANLRAESYFNVRELLRRNLASVPAQFGSTWEELTEPTYSYNRRSALIVEEKSKVKARLGRSPDGADAFALALCRADYGAVIGYG